MGHKCLWCCGNAWYSRRVRIKGVKVNIMINEIIADFIFCGLIIICPVSALIIQKIKDKK